MTGSKRAFHSEALRHERYLAVAGKDLLQSRRVFLGLFEMFFEARGELGIGRGFSHLRQRGNDLLLRAVEVFQFEDVEIFEGIKSPRWIGLIATWDN